MFLINTQVLSAILLFLLVYTIIISEKVHRTIIALFGGLLMIVLGIITQEQALHHIDFNTLGLLSGMMILVGITAQTGLFSYLAIWAAKKVDADPLKLFFVLSLLTAVLSAFLDNVTTVLLTVPVTISITRQLEIKPAPYLIAQIIASNIGGTATLVGDPPNIMIGSAVKELTFMAFINNLAAVSVVILIISLLILALIYFPEMKTSPALRQKILEIDETKQITNHTLLMICIGVLSLTILLFTTHQFFHLATATIALFGASVLLLFTSVSGKPSLERIFHKIEWTALFFFIGLFILVGGLIETGVISYVAQKSIALTAGNLTFTALLLLWVSAIASAFVDNIPFVATMIPLIKDMGTLGLTHLEPLWWSLSLGACLGGNGTLVGASANIIVAGLAAQEGYPLSFTGYLRVGFPLMLLSIVIASLYIYFRYLC